MPSSPGLLLMAMIVSVSVIPTKYSTVSTTINNCEKAFTDCEEFQTPTHDVGTYSCKFIAGRCIYRCELTCPRHSIGRTSSPTSKETYVCSKPSWTRENTPRDDCIEMSVKEVMQNFHHVDEVNTLIRTLLNTSYIYLAMATFYERADVSLPGFSKLMTELWQTDGKHARDFMTYSNKRGGYITLAEIPSPSSYEMTNRSLAFRPGLVGLEAALSVTRDVNERALQLHKSATGSRRSADPHLKFFLEERIISSKTDTIKKLADVIRQLKNFADEDYAVGEYIVDLELVGDKGDVHK